MRELCLVCFLAAGCSVETSLASLSIVSPAPGASFVRDQLGTSGALVASVGVEVAAGGDIARVAILGGDALLGELTDAALDHGMLAAEVRQLGPVTLSAVAYGDDGAELLRTSVDITVDEPVVESCQGWLDLYRLDYMPGPTRDGVADPVTVKLPLGGLSYRYSANTTARETLFGDCELMHSLAQAAPILRARGIEEVIDIGIYNYRCIDQSKTPPNCNMSQHAYAKAIDIAGFVDGEGTTYSVLDDWVIDTTDTCTAETEGDKDAFLHEVICELKAAGVWNIVLTPNYNSAHRNHFHVDLTPGSDFIKRVGGPGHDAIAIGEHAD